MDEHDNQSAETELTALDYFPAFQDASIEVYKKNDQPNVSYEMQQASAWPQVKFYSLVIGINFIGSLLALIFFHYVFLKPMLKKHLNSNKKR